MDSPLLFPVKLKDDTIFVLDETLLPFKEEYIKVVNIDEALKVLKDMKTRSLGQVLLYFYSCILFRKEISFNDLAQSFTAARPTFDFSMLAYIMQAGVSKGARPQDVVFGFVKGFDAARKKRAAYLASILPKPANILTICNVNGELLYLYEELKKLDKQGIFYVSETRPYLQGTRQTFWELDKNQVPAKVVCDNQAAALMEKGLVNCVVTGADRATSNGDIVNKIGTYALARLAQYFKIPFYPLTQYPRNMDIDTIIIEERPKEEAFMFLPGAVAIDAFYPAFDAVRREFITKPIMLEMV
jgi:methylthioribose-1-phosphate isomerase